MSNKENIYFSLDEARAELSMRWNNIELRKAIEVELGDLFWPECREMPRALLFRQLLSPDNGYAFFIQAAHYIGAEPFAPEYLGDTYFRNNREKQGWGRLRAVDGNRKMVIDLVSFNSQNRKTISEVVTCTGEKLTDFHHRLLEIEGYQIERRDMTDWCRSIGKPADYYYPFLLHTVAHGVFFDNPFTADERDNVFTNAVVMPAIKKIEERFGLRALIVRLYPDEETQTDEEDFYWWCYPPRVNDYIVEYARKHKLTFRPWQAE